MARGSRRRLSGGGVWAVGVLMAAGWSRVAGGAPLAPPPAGVQVVTVYGQEYAVIDHPGNRAWDPATDSPPNPPSQLIKHERPIGQVNYTYALARTEVNTGQWLEFMNTFSTQAPPSWVVSKGLTFFYYGGPATWAATDDRSYTGPGTRYELLNVNRAAECPVGNLTFREAAIFCNWLSNGKQSTWESLLNGAYDFNTFGRKEPGSFEITDQIAHSPGAKFWMPTIDEWIKGGYYDPNRSGQNQGGYWLYPNRTDTPLVGGPPGSGQANAGSGANPFTPVGSYGDQPSPWGLLDVSGSVDEWLESPDQTPSGEVFGRYIGGQSFAAGTTGYIQATSYGGDTSPWAGLRLATSAVPAPGTSALLMACTMYMGVSQRRRK